MPPLLLTYNDSNNLNYLFSYSEISKILCAENKGARGIDSINKYIKRRY